MLADASLVGILALLIASKRSHPLHETAPMSVIKEEKMFPVVIVIH